MIAGFALEGRNDRHVIGIDASATIDKTRAQVARIARSTAEMIGLGRDLTDDEITIVDGYHAGTYGIPDARRSMRSGRAQGWRGCSPIRSTRVNRWPA